MHQKWHIQTWACVPLDINPNLRPKCAPQSQSWGMWGKHEEPYVYTCPFQMPTEEMDPKKLCLQNISSLWLWLKQQKSSNRQQKKYKCANTRSMWFFFFFLRWRSMWFYHYTNNINYKNISPMVLKISLDQCQKKKKI